uniref:Uncharacterized protein n=1 Tax=Setaria viridis TaxID=4556 RepID=A0A4U6ULB3_SETVI|nr:hypothetical protein SEVIR_5G291000v2 [Setaria viridis]
MDAAAGCKQTLNHEDLLAPECGHPRGRYALVGEREGGISSPWHLRRCSSDGLGRGASAGTRAGGRAPGGRPAGGGRAEHGHCCQGAGARVGRGRWRTVADRGRRGAGPPLLEPRMLKEDEGGERGEVAHGRRPRAGRSMVGRSALPGAGRGGRRRAEEEEPCCAGLPGRMAAWRSVQTRWAAAVLVEIF